MAALFLLLFEVYLCICVDDTVVKFLVEEDVDEVTVIVTAIVLSVLQAFLIMWICINILKPSLT